MKKNAYLFSFLFAVLVVFPMGTARGEDLIVEDDQDPTALVTDVTLVWDPNSEPDLAGYNVYYGRVSGVYLGLVTVGQPTAIIGVRGSRTVYFAVTAFNSNGDESGFSQEVHWP